MSWSDCFLGQSKYFDHFPHRKTEQKQKYEKVVGVTEIYKQE